jgi:hypothetical protein
MLRSEIETRSTTIDVCEMFERNFFRTIERAKVIEAVSAYVPVHKLRYPIHQAECRHKGFSPVASIPASGVALTRRST